MSNQTNNLNNFLENLFKEKKLSTGADPSFVAHLSKQLKIEYRKIYHSKKDFSFRSFFPPFPNFSLRLAVMPAMAFTLIIVFFAGLTFYSQSSRGEIVSLKKSVNDLEVNLNSLDQETQKVILDTGETINQEFDALETM